ncbi:MAG: nucleotidyltransferase domain-containing protein [Nitrospinae bacterium]|nr:nucleotidyltransferase domain-containing protein [Nitrospinota bacterium]
MTNPLKNAVKTIVRVAKPDKIILFGSRAGGRQKAVSDYDLLVIKKNLRNQRRLVHDIYLRFKNIGAPVDVLAIDMDRFEELKDDPYLIYGEAYQKGRVIYEKTPKGRRVAKSG